MSLVEHFSSALSRVLLLTLQAMVLFNVLTDVAQKTGIAGGLLTTAQMQGFGLASLIIALLDTIANRFFGLKIVP